jgi:hypothetical protein
MTDLTAPAWLAPHLQPGESVRWSEAPGGEAWRRVLFSVALWAYLTFYVGFRMPSWWEYLPIWPERNVSPVLGAIVLGLGFLADSARTALRHRYTAYAVTDQRLLRVPLRHPLSRLLPEPKADAWPLEQVRVVERERKHRRRARVRVQVESKAGRRLARFRMEDVRDEQALLDALRPPPTTPRVG